MEFHNLQCLSDTGISKKSHKMVKECGMHGVKIILNRILIGKREGKSPI